jgi:hypothetical protein
MYVKKGIIKAIKLYEFAVANGPHFSANNLATKYFEVEEVERTLKKQRNYIYYPMRKVINRLMVIWSTCI